MTATAAAPSKTAANPGDSSRDPRRTFEVSIAAAHSPVSGAPHSSRLSTGDFIYARKGTMNKVEIETRDGSCPAYVYRPSGNGPWPAALVYMDGVGIRPAMLELGERLATYGYFVLLPDLFYRSGLYEPMDPHTLFSDPVKRKVL